MAKTSVVIGIVVIVVAAAALFYFYAPQVPSIEAGKTLTGLQMAERTGELLAGMESGGRMVSFLNCERGEDGASCAPADVNFTVLTEDGFEVLDFSVADSNSYVLANLALFEATGKAEYKNRADRVFGQAFGDCSANDNCQELLQSMVAYYKDTGDERYKQAVVELADLFLAADPEQRDLLFNFLQLDLALAAHDITGEDSYLEKAESVYDRIAILIYSGQTEAAVLNEVVYAGEDGVLQKFSCSLGSYMIEFRERTGDGVWAGGVTGLFDSTGLADNVGEIRDPAVLASCADFVADADAAGFSGYKQVGVALVQGAVDGYRDSGKFDGGGFLDTMSDSANSKSVGLNSQFVVTLSKLKDEIFEVAG